MRGIVSRSFGPKCSKLIVSAGSLDYETKDAKYFAEVGIDYLKYDNCFNLGRFGTPLISFQRYEVMWKAINATGRPMLYSLCNWGEDYTHAVRHTFTR